MAICYSKYVIFHQISIRLDYKTTNGLAEYGVTSARTLVILIFLGISPSLRPSPLSGSPLGTRIIAFILPTDSDIYYLVDP